MSLNKFMHPRNRYKNSKPSFLHLALKYPDFRAHTTQDDSGKVFLDFKNADALRALTRCLLKEDFGLSVELPADRLVPTLPLRLNYIHWLEDIVGTGEDIWGIDVGTGASCIYPLLAAKMNKWHFLATEADSENAFYAKKNVTANGFDDMIHVKKVSAEDILIAPLESFTTNSRFDFCMCNPPFFADHMEAQAVTSTRSVDRPEAGTLSTASPQECIAQGGEVGFVRQMIDESAVLRNKIRVFTSMVGKKASLAPLKAELLHHKVAKLSTTEFCQGKTMRWGIAWTFDSSVTFPRSEFESRKEKPPIQYIVPKGVGGVQYRVHEVATYLRQLLESIKVHCFQGKKAKSYTSIILTAAENTWCHQRRLRREQKRQQQQGTGQHEIPAQSSDFNSDAKNGQQEASSDKDNTFGDNTDDVTSVESCHLNERAEVMSGGSCSSRKRPAEQLSVDISESIKRCRREETAENEVNKFTELGEDESVVVKQTVEMVTLAVPDGTSHVSVTEANGHEHEKRIQSSIDSQSQVCSDAQSKSKLEEIKPDKDGQLFTKQLERIPSAILDHTPVLDVSMTEANEGKEERQQSGNKSQSEVSADTEAKPEGHADSSPKDYVLKCVMRLKRVDDRVQMELEYLGGQSRELMHQVFTFLKNKLSQSVK